MNQEEVIYFHKLFFALLERQREKWFAKYMCYWCFRKMLKYWSTCSFSTFENILWQCWNIDECDFFFYFEKYIMVMLQYWSTCFFYLAKHIMKNLLMITKYNFKSISYIYMCVWKYKKKIKSFKSKTQINFYNLNYNI